MAQQSDSSSSDGFDTNWWCWLAFLAVALRGLQAIVHDIWGCFGSKQAESSLSRTPASSPSLGVPAPVPHRDNAPLSATPDGDPVPVVDASPEPPAPDRPLPGMVVRHYVSKNPERIMITKTGQVYHTHNDCHYVENSKKVQTFVYCDRCLKLD